MAEEILILSDDDENDLQCVPLPAFTNDVADISKQESDWDKGVVPLIVGTATLSGSESSFSGFSATPINSFNDKRLQDDLEIVEEVIRDIMPGKIKDSQPQQQRMHYRERKLGFQWLKVKREKDAYPIESFSDTTNCGSVDEASDLLEVSNDDVISSNLSHKHSGNRVGEVTGVSQPENDERRECTFKSPRQKKRSFAAMRCSSTIRKFKKQKRDSEAASRSEVSHSGTLNPSIREALNFANGQETAQEIRNTRERDKKRGSPESVLDKSRRERSEEEKKRGSRESVLDKSRHCERSEEEKKRGSPESVLNKSRRSERAEKEKKRGSPKLVLDKLRHSERSEEEKKQGSPESVLDKSRRSERSRVGSDENSSGSDDRNDIDCRSWETSLGSSDEDEEKNEGEKDTRNKDKEKSEDGGSNEKGEASRLPRRATSIISNHDYGRLVWGKTGSCRPWPAVVVCHKNCGEMRPPAEKAWLLWFGDYRITKVPLTNIKDFVKNFKDQYAKTYHEKYKKAVLECLKECRKLAGLEELSSVTAYMKWAENGMTGISDIRYVKDLCSSNILCCLSRIRKMRMREASSSEQSFFPTSTSSDAGNDSCAEERNTWKPKAALLKAVCKGTRDIETLCISCDRVDCEVEAPHRYFYGGTCSACKDELEDLSGFLPDGTIMYCLICGSPGELIICDNADCEKVFCSGCIELLVSPKAVSVIMDTDPWYCFLCEPYQEATHGLLKPRPDWQEKASSSSVPQTKETPEVEDETPDISTFRRKPLRVLSLFDGICTGLFVLDKLGLEVEIYYASEIHESAKNVASLNFGSRVTHVGDVQALTDKKIGEMCPIDLLIGGSPCNDLSFVNPNRKGLFDPTGSGILFFHFFRVLKTIQTLNKNNHLFWLFENVNHMPREFKTHINIFFQREPVVIDAKFFSPQSRPRCFWGNIPDMYKPLPPEILRKSHPLQKCASKVNKRSALADKVNCITTNSNSLKQVFQMNDHADVPWITEIEKIFGFPTHYTDVGNLNIRERQALLGRSWSVGVIEYILKPLTRYFPHSKHKPQEWERESSTVQSNGKEIKKNKAPRCSK